MLYFARAFYLWLLLLVPAILVGYALLRRLRRARVRRFGDEELVRTLMPSWSSAKGWWRTVLFCLGFTAFVIGMARPLIGAKLVERETKGAEIAKTYGVRVYTIGVGANGMAPYPVMTPWGVEMQNMQVEIDEELLKGISEATGGRYFRATDKTKLAEIYSEINKMEKARTSVDSFPVYKELFGRFGVAALICLLLELLVGLLLRRMP